MWLFIFLTLFKSQLFHAIILIVVLILPQTTQPVNIRIQIRPKCNLQQLLIFLVFQELVGSVLNGDVSVLVLLLIHFRVFWKDGWVVFLSLCVIQINVFHPNMLILGVIVQTSLRTKVIERLIVRLLLVPEFTVMCGKDRILLKTLDDRFQVFVTKTFRVLNHSFFENVRLFLHSFVLTYRFVEFTVDCRWPLLLRLHSLRRVEVGEGGVRDYSRALWLMLLASSTTKLRIATILRKPHSFMSDTRTDVVANSVTVSTHRPHFRHWSPAHLIASCLSLLSGFFASLVLFLLHGSKSSIENIISAQNRPILDVILIILALLWISFFRFLAETCLFFIANFWVVIAIPFAFRLGDGKNYWFQVCLVQSYSSGSISFTKVFFILFETIPIEFLQHVFWNCMKLDLLFETITDWNISDGSFRRILVGFSHVVFILPQRWKSVSVDFLDNNLSLATQSLELLHDGNGVGACFVWVNMRLQHELLALLPDHFVHLLGPFVVFEDVFSLLFLDGPLRQSELTLRLHTVRYIL